jgi:hypothetical protein
VLSIQPYSIICSYFHLAEKVFEKPEEFIPERWSEKPELVKAIDAYAPFSRGMSFLASSLMDTHSDSKELIHVSAKAWL